MLNISLHAVKVQNWDMTITVIPTFKLVEAPFKNWCGLQESGGRRIKRSIHVDVTSVRFCDEAMISRFREIDLIKDYVETELAALDQWNREHHVNPRSLVNGRQLTNLNAFREYVSAYLRSRQDLHHDKMTLLVRQLEPGPSGLPIEVYAFTRTVDWIEYENIQAEIFGHLVAAVPEFGPRLLQEPAGIDFQALIRAQ